MLIFRLIDLFWVTTRKGLHILMLQKPIGFLIMSSVTALYSPFV